MDVLITDGSWMISWMIGMGMGANNFTKIANISSYLVTKSPLLLQIVHCAVQVRVSDNQEPTKTSKQPTRTRYLGHVTCYPPIRDQYFLTRGEDGILKEAPGLMADWTDDRMKFNQPNLNPLPITTPLTLT
eukprot:sb/3475086/